MSTDSDLGQIIDKLKNQIPEISEIKTTEDMVNAAMYKTTVQVGEKLLVHQVMLLPCIHDTFVDCATDNADTICSVRM